MKKLANSFNPPPQKKTLQNWAKLGKKMLWKLLTVTGKDFRKHNIYTLLYNIDNKDLLYSTGKPTQ